MVASNFVVERIVARRHLERARSEFPLHAFVGDHRHPAFDDRDDHLAPDGCAVTVVLGMYRDGDVREDRRGPYGRDRDVAVAVGEGIADIGQRIVDVDVRELEVGQRRQVERAPVDDPVGAVDPALAVQVHEEAHDRTDVRVVHREALAAIVQ